ncbi:ankyrin repeat family protein [Tanacetum coccineum]
MASSGSTSSNHLNKVCKPLYSAIRGRNWEKAREIINTGEFSWIDKLNSYGHTPLHLAVGAFKDIQVATDILKEINPEVLATTLDIIGMTPAHHGSDCFGNVAYELIKDYPSMATTVYRKVGTPLECILTKPDLFYSATHYNFYQRFIYRCVPIQNHSFGSPHTADIENQKTTMKDKLITKSTNRCLYDVPHIKLLKENKAKHDTTIKLLRCICEEVDKTNTESDIMQQYGEAAFIAVENDTAEAIEVMVTYFRETLLLYNDGYVIFQSAIMNRSDKVYNVLKHLKNFDKSIYKTSIDEDGNNLLHLAGRLAPIHKLNAVSGAALQMQRELQWFEEVKKLVNPKHTQTQNKYKETPIMVFRRQHNDLRKEGEEWMKKTADSYTITAALIITIVFAAAITVPGGNNGDNEKPIYEKETSFIIFAVSDAISLFTSTTSLLLFLSILTARYADEDFLYKLPKRLIFGLTMLFLSVTSMMIAFSATLYIMFGQEKQWILIPIGALACLPIASFVTLQFPLLVELVSSTYGQGIFGN